MAKAKAKAPYADVLFVKVEDAGSDDAYLNTQTDWEGFEDGDEIAVYTLHEIQRVRVEKTLENV